MFIVMASNHTEQGVPPSMHTWGKGDGPSSIRLSFILGLAALVMPAGIILLALKPPEQLVAAQVISPNSAQSFQVKVNQLERMQAGTASADEVHLTADEISSAFSQSTAGGDGPSAVTLHNDVVTGQFLAKVARQQIYVTVSGHLGAKDGYITFEPTDFKVGNLTIPVALVKPALQKKMEDEREQLKLPAFVADLRVENGELVIRPK
jgi:uncharacterized protein YpmS